MLCYEALERERGVGRWGWSCLADLINNASEIHTCHDHLGDKAHTLNANKHNCAFHIHAEYENCAYYWIFPHLQSVRKQLRCEKRENKIWIGTHLLSLGLQGTWQNNDGDMEEHQGDLHSTNWCLSVCRVLLLLEEDCHILVHCNTVIRQLVWPSSEATINNGSAQNLAKRRISFNKD